MELFNSFCMSLPAGYKFLPTEEELVVYYLENKVFCRPIPPHVILECGYHDIFSKSPKEIGELLFFYNNLSFFFFFLQLASSSWKGLGWSGKECYFFIPEDDEDFDFDFNGKTIRMVGNGIGFWKSNVDEKKALINMNGKKMGVRESEKRTRLL
ncbi:hypothetical protein JRO89_XS13G0258300 [Xanthoceras sorbifolium]|uniref:NAC domain-containing protein n=1 Tax=Xanthoceras sorbifolium TaxID=99658 RepID=A0ABQ8H9Z6_9ROSI|nr:hypothetical protein JRO89_XS13G0258300 [Xanthoceras sorbifolium]